jgi:DNA-binding phage protein
MARPVRLNVTLDAEHAEKLSRLAARVHVNEGTLARSLLATALDDADPSPQHIVALLDGIPGAYERTRLASEQGQRGETIALDDLV